MHIHFLVEEQSSQEALNNLLPKMFNSRVSYSIHPFRGKKDLIKQLPKRLKAYKAWITNEDKIVVLIDEDRADCQKLKQQLENIASDSGFLTKSSAGDGAFQVLNRIAIEELEAWFFGDIEAIIQAYPKVKKNIVNQAKYRNPDAIKGGTAEALEKLLKRYGYHKGGLSKIQAAREISHYMNPENNRSTSFQVFYQGLLQMIE